MNRFGSRLLFVSLVVLLLLGATPVRAQRYDAASRKSADSSAASALDAEKVRLGKRLFFDNRLSVDEWLSCSSCHDPAHGFSDARRVSVGVLGQRGKRHSPTLLGRGLGESQFWDGRAATLEEQVLQPIVNPEEMGMASVDVLLPRLRRDPAYRNLTQQSLAEALASYVRSIRSMNSDYDFFIAGWTITFSDLELEGLRLFRGKAQCYLCHSGANFSDESFHNTGVAWKDGLLDDEGRATITGKPYHRGAFKTPSLRDVGRRGPYMHDGSLLTLEDVVDFYDRGGNRNPYLDDNVAPLHLTAAEKRALLEFLRHGLAGTIQEGPVEKRNEGGGSPGVRAASVHSRQ